MEEIHQQEKVRQLGISNCYHLSTLQKLFESATVKPTVLQNRFYQETEYDDQIRSWCLEKGIVYQSFWTLTANPHLLESEEIQALANKLNKTTPVKIGKCAPI